MPIEYLRKEIDSLSKSDFLRVYLLVTAKFNTMREEDSKKVSKLLYGVKNPDKVKECLNRQKDKKMRKNEQH